MCNNNSLSLNRESMYKAESKVREARNLVKKAKEENNSELMFKAVELYSEAIIIYPRIIEAYLSIAYICIEYNKTNEAIHILNKVLEFDSSNKKVNYLLTKAKNIRRNKIVEKYQSNVLEEKIPKIEKITQKEVISVEIKAKIPDKNFNILTELFDSKHEINSETSSLERKVDVSQLHKKKIEELEKLRQNNSSDVKVKVSSNSSFMRLFGK